ncbi:MAG: ABC transporter ATP-binding protein [Candidatus Saccharibacteria bacterium]|nr:ABC transporter ATP-binding protein [Candidatus Saccharibacteria bacterium]
MVTNQPIIELENIKKTYRTSADIETKALRGISLAINEGDFVAIMGASGSGKSSLMSIIGLLDRQFEGTYKLNGKEIAELSDNQLSELRSESIGFIFQQFNLLKRTSVLENVLLPTTYKSGPDDERRALQAIKQVGLEKFINNHTSQLSGGQMQRVAIARALMMNPSILLADEPTGNLDHNTAHEIMELFKKINKQGTTIVLITHEDDIADFADRKLALFDGQFRKERSR